MSLDEGSSLSARIFHKVRQAALNGVVETMKIIYDDRSQFAEVWKLGDVL
jgi:hypothetical protein